MTTQKNYSAYNHAKIQMIGFIAEVFNENSEKVAAFSKTISEKTKVAKTRLAVNLYGQNEADYWDVVAYGNENNSYLHDLLVNYAQKGTKVFIEGTPKLNKQADEKNKYYPQIVVEKLIFLSQVEKAEKEEETPKAARFRAPSPEAVQTAPKTQKPVNTPTDDDFLNDFFGQGSM